jgi:thioredoxin 1
MTDGVEEIKKKKLSSLMQKLSSESAQWPKKPLKVTDQNITEMIKAYPLVVIDCWAPWCGPCRMLGPVIDELAEKMHGNVVFAKLNTDENRRTSSQYGIMSIPTLLLFKNGNLVDRNIGALPPDMLSDWIERYV